MNYTQSDHFVVDAGTGFNRHEDNAAIPTAWTEKDANGLIWSLVELAKMGGQGLLSFDETNSATYKVLVKGLKAAFGGNVTTLTFGNSPVGAPLQLTLDHAGLILVNAAAGNVAATLPAANVLAVPVRFQFVRIDAVPANTATFTCAGADAFISGGTSFTLVNQGESRTLASDATSKWGTTSASGTTPAAGRNLLINGNFNVNQRAYVSATNTGTANQYTLDRWRVITSGQNLAFAASGNGNQVTAPAGGIEQIVRGANIGSAAGFINWSGTATCTVDGVAKTKGAAVVLVPGTNCSVKFFNGTVSRAQLETGAAATAYEDRPIELELLLAQGYWKKIFMALQAGTGAGGAHIFGMSFSTMRATPSVAISTVNGSGLSTYAVSSNSMTLAGAPDGNGRVAADVTLDAEI
ncbi:MAG: hypothetical protein V4451_05980 [Pseudomonadota bacterium]